MVKGRKVLTSFDHPLDYHFRVLRKVGNLSWGWWTKKIILTVLILILSDFIVSRLVFLLMKHIRGAACYHTLVMKLSTAFNGFTLLSLQTRQTIWHYSLWYWSIISSLSYTLALEVYGGRFRNTTLCSISENYLLRSYLSLTKVSGYQHIMHNRCA